MTMGRTRSPATVTHTRFFTIINQHMPRRPTGRPDAIPCLRRVIPLADGRPPAEWR